MDQKPVFSFMKHRKNMTNQFGLSRIRRYKWKKGLPFVVVAAAVVDATAVVAAAVVVAADVVEGAEIKYICVRDSGYFQYL